MTTEQIAKRLAEYCAKGEFEAAQKELYADDVVSVEPYETPAFPKEEKGLDNIIEKGRKFESMIEEAHGITVGEPVVTGNVFSFVMSMDLTMKERGRAKWEELCVYTVKDGKIVSEHFFM
ncbi:nuclear transport factor 2 family protein [Chitinophaga barathri]|uniref:Nuclear transport factor 2 family protein n=1 Tax=Chitinophaga barathri TaxID=1647451 RepID=A0A3N4M917_9BACT|nr:nuclear transport factor 2 family protein [Chitinophaga barathri]RPD39898.1 nuclear transport factor 2 family protein [Chitinophaga barathri]